MQIVITDGYTLNPGDLSWEPFYALGEVKYHDRTPFNYVASFCRDATVIVTNKTPVTAETINYASKLKVIAVTATGYNVVDIQAAKRKGILVCNVPEYGTDSVAQHTVALMLELTNHVGKHAGSVSKGEWSDCDDWCYVKAPVIELSGKIMGIVGPGKIGCKVAEIVTALGMNVIFYDKNNRSGLPGCVSLQELFTDSDVISLHCPLKEDNVQFINKSLLSSMKPAAFLINTSRGQLINEQDLADALKERKIAGAALDVLSVEPPKNGNPLIGLPNCIVTPHNAWISFEARQRLMEATFENVKSALSGHPQNVVNK